VRAGSARACLILEGEEADFGRAPIPRSAYEGALITLGVVYGLPVLRSRSPEHTAELLVRAACQASRSRPAPPLRRSSTSSSLRRLQSLLLQTIPDIGPHKAAALLEAFGTPAAIVAATRNELGAVRGLGKTLSRRLWWVLHERASPAGPPTR
jgi:ERCC4-type nuclease